MSRSAVYAAEDQWSAVLDRGGVVDFFGSRIDVPVQRRFGDLDGVRRYVDLVMGLPAVQAEFSGAASPTVRERSGQTRAHYEPDTATIAIPLREFWAGREAVVLHELTHHLMGRPVGGAPVEWHGAEYRTAMCRLVGCVLGESASLLLRAGYEEAGLAVPVAR